MTQLIFVANTLHDKFVLTQGAQPSIFYNLEFFKGKYAVLQRSEGVQVRIEREEEKSTRQDMNPRTA